MRRITGPIAITWYKKNFSFFIIPLPLEFLPGSGLWTQRCASTLCTALLCSCMAGSWSGAWIQIGLWAIYLQTRVLPMPIMLSIKLYSPTLSRACTLYYTYAWFVIIYYHMLKDLTFNLVYHPLPGFKHRSPRPWSESNNFNPSAMGPASISGFYKLNRKLFSTNTST